MNGSPTSPATAASLPDQVSRIDASCRVLLLPILGALLWLVAGSVLALITSVKLHSPTVLADCPWFAYGNTRPAANDALAYGFASQAGLAIALWMLCRLGRTTLVGAIPVAIGTLFWNLGVALGVMGVLGGHTTGFEWLEFPNAGSVILIASYAVLGVSALLTFRSRQSATLYPSQWYILAALFWFPWLYTTARLLLVWFPVRGVMQTAVNLWFANGLFTLWLGSLALAVLLYFIPKLVNAPLHSRTLAVLAFWSLAIFGAWAGPYQGLPLPAWMVSVGRVASVLLLVPVIATVANLWITMGNGSVRTSPLLSFFKVSLICFALTSVFGAFAAFIPQLRLTIFAEGNEQLALYGFVGLALFGAIHYLVPRLTGVENDKYVRASSLAVTVGIVVYAGAYLLGGMLQQKNLINGAVPFVEVMNKTKMFIRLSSMGLVLIVLGNLGLLARIVVLLKACCRVCCSSCCGETKKSVKLKTAEAAR